MNVWWSFIASALITALLAALVLRIARARGWMDHPVDRSMHRQATPSAGGVSMVIVILVALAATSQPPLLIASAAVLSVMGFIDDLRPLPVLPRLLIQIFAVAIGFWAIGGLPEISLGDSTYVLLPAAQVVAALACMWYVNLYNFMDGIDGLAAFELSFVAAVAAWLCAGTDLSIVWAVLAGAGLGFLVWNKPRARIFMGDAGSGFLGFLIALLLVLSVRRGDFSLWTALVLVAPFACDATITLLRRMARGDPWYRPHVSHAYQKLARRWGSHGRVLLALAMLNFVLVLPAALVIERAPSVAPFVASGVLAIISALVWRAGAGKP